MTDSLFHACLAGITAFFLGLAYSYRAFSVGLIGFGLVFTATLHGLYDNFANGWLGAALAIATVLVFVGYVATCDEIGAQFHEHASTAPPKAPLSATLAHPGLVGPSRAAGRPAGDHGGGAGHGRAGFCAPRAPCGRRRAVRGRAVSIAAALTLSAACANHPGQVAAPLSRHPTSVSASMPAQPAADPPSPQLSPAATADTAASPAAPTEAIGPAYVFPIRGCRSSYAHAHHDYPATDISAARGCAFVAVTGGRVDEVSPTDSWSSGSNAGPARGGLSVSVVGADGVRYYGSHLSAIAPGVVPGARVTAGQLLGRVGDSGDARGLGTHVHFGISWPTAPGRWWIRRGELFPWPYLDAWAAGARRSPAVAVRALRTLMGPEPACHVHC